MTWFSLTIFSSVVLVEVESTYLLVVSHLRHLLDTMLNGLLPDCEILANLRYQLYLRHRIQTHF